MKSIFIPVTKLTLAYLAIHHHHHHLIIIIICQFLNFFFFNKLPFLLFCFVLFCLFVCLFVLTYHFFIIFIFFIILLFRRRRSPKNVNFTADMVHILPGYPKQSDDPPGVILLAFYLSLPQGISESNIVPERVLHGIVMGQKENIQTSIGGEITSVGPFPSGTEQLKDEESDKENDGKSKLTNVVIGASVGGGLLLIIIAAVLVGCKKTNGYF